MPLVFAVLIILVLYFNLRDSKEKNIRLSAMREKDRRKTNARLEHKILDTYMKHGYSFDKAFRQAYQDMVNAGYEPCIPREAYKKNRNGEESSWCGVYGTDVERYDSLWVQQRREHAENEWQKSHPGEPFTSDEKIEAMTYSHFPTSEYSYLHDIKRVSMQSKALPIGSYLIYPGLGTCEILAHNWIGDSTLGGTYTLKVLKTGEIVTHVKIGDDRIRRQGQ